MVSKVAVKSPIDVVTATIPTNFIAEPSEDRVPASRPSHAIVMQSADRIKARGFQSGTINRVTENGMSNVVPS